MATGTDLKRLLEFFWEWDKVWSTVGWFPVFPLSLQVSFFDRFHPEAESKEKQVVWYPMPELTITSPYVDSIVDSNTCTMGGQPCARVDLNPMPESTSSPSQGFRIWPLDVFFREAEVRNDTCPTVLKQKGIFAGPTVLKGHGDGCMVHCAETK